MTEGPNLKFLMKEEKRKIVHIIKRAHDRTNTIRAWTKNRGSIKISIANQHYNYKKENDLNKQPKNTERTPGEKELVSSTDTTTWNQSTSKWDAEIQQRFKNITDFIEKQLLK